MEYRNFIYALLRVAVTTESADYDVFMFEDKEVSKDEWDSLTNEYLLISSDLIIWNSITDNIGIDT
ncbi:MAG: hypothetical protein QM697_10670 [Lachnospiraceae bacterium]